MKKFAAIACLILGSAFAALADDGPLSGVWTVSGTVYGNSVNPTCTIKQTEKALSGSCKAEGIPDAKVTGSVDGKNATFQFDIDYNGTPLTLVFNGALDEKMSSMAGKINVQPMGIEGEFSAAKAK